MEEKEMSADDPIVKHEWPYPDPFEPGREYLWCPTSSLDEMIEQGWTQTTQDHRYETIRYTLLKKGDALAGIESGTVVPEMFVLAPDVETTPRLETEPVRESEIVSLG